MTVAVGRGGAGRRSGGGVTVGRCPRFGKDSYLPVLGSPFRAILSVPIASAPKRNLCGERPEEREK